MINNLKKLYPKYNLYIKRNKRLYDLDNNLVSNKIIYESNCIVINKNFYTVYKLKVS